MTVHHIDGYRVKQQGTTVHFIEDYKVKHLDSRPREICFHSPTYRDKNGIENVVNICVRVENGDVFGILESVVKNGGIGNMHENGTFFFIPWPCAAIEIRDV